jgi:tetratricopeptide (TPR) repeat protein
LATILIVPVTMLLTKSVNIGEMRRVGEEVLDISPWQYLLTQFRVLVTYIRLLFLPFNQNLDYDYPIAHSLLEPPVLASLIFLIATIIVAIKLFRNHRLVSFGIFWFFITLIPESSLLPINDVIFEHRLYLPMAGFAILLTAGLYELFRTERVKPLAITLSLIVIIFSVLACQRNKVWKDELTLWNDVVRKSPRNVRAYYNRGLAYQGKGDLDQAFLDYNKALKLNPKYAKAYNNRGLAYQDKGDLDQAFSDYNKAIEIDPEYAKAYNNRGGVYFDRGDYDRALLDSSKAIELDPAYAKAYLNRAVAYYRKQEYARSWEDVGKVEELGYKIPSEFLEALKKSSP